MAFHMKTAGQMTNLPDMAAIATGSGLVRFFRAIYRNLVRLIRHSSIFAVLRKPERATDLFRLSTIGRFAASIPDTCTRVLKHFGVFLNRTMDRTLTLWALCWFAERFDVLFLLFVAAHALTPFAQYRNPYTIAALAVLAFSACARVALVRNQSATFSLKRVDPVFLLYFLSAIRTGLIYVAHVLDSFYYVKFTIKRFN
jgi:hypothetical protein